MHVPCYLLAVLFLWSTRSEASSHTSVTLQEIEDLINSKTSIIKDLNHSCTSVVNGQTVIRNGIHEIKDSQNTLLDKNDLLLGGQGDIATTLAVVLQNQKTLKDDVSGLSTGQSDLKAGQGALKLGLQSLSDGQTALEKAGHALNSGQNDLKTGQADIHTKLGGLEEGQTLVNGNLDILKAGQANLQTSVNDVSSTITGVRDAQAGLESSVDDLVVDAAAKAITLANIKSNQENIKTNQDQIKSTEQAILNHVRNLKQKQAANTKAIVAAAETKKEELHSLIIMLQTAQGELKTNTEAIRGNQESFQKDVDDLRAAHSTLPNELLLHLQQQVYELENGVGNITLCLGKRTCFTEFKIAAAGNS